MQCKLISQHDVHSIGYATVYWTTEASLEIVTVTDIWILQHFCLIDSEIHGGDSGLRVECAGLLNVSRQNVSRTNGAPRVAFSCQKG